MKPIFNCLFFVALVLAVTACNKIYAQPAVAKDAYWVIESNVKTPQKATVYFYNRHHQLVYKEAINGVYLDVNKAKVRRQLNGVLKQSLALWQRQNAQLLASRMQ